MEEQRQLYPIGIQTFSIIREENYLYIDKTEYVYRMTHAEAKYTFLSRPRRFGKSLLTSTLHSYFDGRKDLFKGLALEKLEREWNRYPVLHFDMSLGKHLSKEALERYLNHCLQPYEKKYGIVIDTSDSNIRLTNLIRAAYEKDKKKVVVLIDEYDAPLLDVVHISDTLEDLRNIMRNFYSPLKACDPYLKFVFLTGITKFSQLSIFSELNNIKNISMLPEYAAICGITQEELENYMRPGIQKMAKAKNTDEEGALQLLKDNYDGYHFTMPSPDIYNPFSLLNALSDGLLHSYWFGSGTPTYLIEMLRKFHVIPQQLDNIEALASTFDAPTQSLTSAIPLLYQSGYITIKEYDQETELYTLSIPNKEVRIGLMNSLLPEYVGQAKDAGMTMVALLSRDIRRNQLSAALKRLQAFLSTVPYCDHTDYEGHYQQLLYVIFSLLGYYVDVEVRTPDGRVDIVLRTTTHLYVMELKLNKDAATAMRQIDLKEYPKRFALSDLPVVKVGINFDSNKHTITDWDIQ